MKPNPIPHPLGKAAIAIGLSLLAACASNGMDPVYDDGLYGDGLYGAAAPYASEQPT